MTIKVYEVVDAVKYIAMSGVEKFTPMHVSNLLKTDDIKSVLQILLTSKSIEDMASICYDVRCENGHIGYSSKNLNDFNDIKNRNEELLCEECQGKLIVEGLKDIYVSLVFKEEFLNYFKNENSKFK